MKIALIDERASEACRRGLMRIGAVPLTVRGTDMLMQGERSHPDMLIFINEGELFTSAEYYEECPELFSDIHEYLPEIKLRFTDESPKPKYPQDAIFNILCIGDKAFAKTDTASETVLNSLEMRGKKIVHVNQGYPRCTVLAFGTSALTSDKGMAAALRDNGIRVNEIENGDILLPPHKYGFIGGASGVLDRSILFAGSLQSHRSHELMENAVSFEGYTPVSLCDGPLCDIGGIIFLSK